MPATKPLVMVGFSASSRSSVSAASVALEHTSVEPASRVASTANAMPPIQKNGELQNSLSSAVSPRISLRILLVAQQGCVGVHHALGRARRARRVDDGQRIRSVDVVLPSPRAARRRPCRRSSESIRTWRSSGAASLDVGESLPVVVRSEGCSGKQDFGVAVDELYRKLRSGGEGRERYDDGADARGGQHADDERRTVRVEQPDVSALSRAEGDQTAGQLRRAAVGLGVAEALGVAHQQRVLCAGRGPAAAVLRRRSAIHLACSTGWLKNSRTAPRSALPEGVLGIWSTIAMSVGIS